jgi:hypothetical protein
VAKGRDTSRDPRRRVEYGDMFALAGGPQYAPPTDLDQARFYDEAYRAGWVGDGMPAHAELWQQRESARGWLHGHYDGADAPCHGCH